MPITKRASVGSNQPKIAMFFATPAQKQEPNFKRKGSTEDQDSASKIEARAVDVAAANLAKKTVVDVAEVQARCLHSRPVGMSKHDEAIEEKTILEGASVDAVAEDCSMRIESASKAEDMEHASMHVSQGDGGEARALEADVCLEAAPSPASASSSAPASASALAAGFPAERAADSDSALAGAVIGAGAAEALGSSAVGLKLRKLFQAGWFEGEVVAFRTVPVAQSAAQSAHGAHEFADEGCSGGAAAARASVGLWTVRYEDGDEEDLEAAELAEALGSFNSAGAEAAASAPASSAASISGTTAAAAASAAAAGEAVGDDTWCPAGWAVVTRVHGPEAKKGAGTEYQVWVAPDRSEYKTLGGAKKRLAADLEKGIEPGSVTGKAGKKHKAAGAATKPLVVAAAAPSATTPSKAPSALAQAAAATAPTSALSAEAVKTPSSGGGSGGGGGGGWVQCDACSKWRRLPPTANPEELPEEWFCRLATWDPTRSSCDAAQEPTSDAGSGGRGGAKRASKAATAAAAAAAKAALCPEAAALHARYQGELEAALAELAAAPHAQSADYRLGLDDAFAALGQAAGPCAGPSAEASAAEAAAAAVDEAPSPALDESEAAEAGGASGAGEGDAAMADDAADDAAAEVSPPPSSSPSKSPTQPAPLPFQLAPGFPAELLPALARLVQGSPAPLKELAAEVTAVFQARAAADEAAAAAEAASDEAASAEASARASARARLLRSVGAAAVEAQVPLVAERVAYGAAPKSRLLVNDACDPAALFVWRALSAALLSPEPGHRKAVDACGAERAARGRLLKALGRVLDACAKPKFDALKVKAEEEKLERLKEEDKARRQRQAQKEAKEHERAREAEQARREKAEKLEAAAAAAKARSGEKEKEAEERRAREAERQKAKDEAEAEAEKQRLLREKAASKFKGFFKAPAAGSPAGKALAPAAAAAAAASGAAPGASGAAVPSSHPSHGPAPSSCPSGALGGAAAATGLSAAAASASASSAPAAHGPGLGAGRRTDPDEHFAALRAALSRGALLEARKRERAAGPSGSSRSPGSPGSSGASGAAAAAAQGRRPKWVSVLVSVPTAPTSEANAFGFGGGGHAYSELKEKTFRNKVKVLQFQEDERPPYRGTWSKASRKVTGRRPFAKDQSELRVRGRPSGVKLDYEVDSEEEWEEEEVGEDLDKEDGDDKDEEDDALDYDDGFLRRDDELGSDAGDSQDGAGAAGLVLSAAAAAAAAAAAPTFLGPFRPGDPRAEEHVGKYRAVAMPWALSAWTGGSGSSSSSSSSSSESIPVSVAAIGRLPLKVREQLVESLAANNMEEPPPKPEKSASAAGAAGAASAAGAAAGGAGCGAGAGGAGKRPLEGSGAEVQGEAAPLEGAAESGGRGRDGAASGAKRGPAVTGLDGDSLKALALHILATLEPVDKLVEGFLAARAAHGEPASSKAAVKRAIQELAVPPKGRGRWTLKPDVIAKLGLEPAAAAAAAASAGAGAASACAAAAPAGTEPATAPLAKPVLASPRKAEPLRNTIMSSFQRAAKPASPAPDALGTPAAAASLPSSSSSSAVELWPAEAAGEVADEAQVESDVHAPVAVECESAFPAAEKAVP